jgi:hypothetical protein
MDDDDDELYEIFHSFSGGWRGKTTAEITDIRYLCKKGGAEEFDLFSHPWLMDIKLLKKLIYPLHDFDSSRLFSSSV